MEQGICKNCERLMVINESQLGSCTCSLNNKIYPPNVYSCNFFRPKKVEDKELGKASDIKNKETLKGKGQNISEEDKHFMIGATE